VPLQHYLYHEEEVYKLRQGDGGFDGGAVATAVRRQKEKVKAKEMNAENKNMQAQRSREKQHNASVAMGNKGFMKDKGGGRGGGGRGGGAGRGAGAGGVRKIGDVSGSRSQWVALLNLVRAGGEWFSGLQALFQFCLPNADTAVAVCRYNS
jgi:hypothetical protein